MALCNATRYTCMPVRACLYHHCVLHQLTLSSCLSCQQMKLPLLLLMLYDAFWLRLLRFYFLKIYCPEQPSSYRGESEELLLCTCALHTVSCTLQCVMRMFKLTLAGGKLIKCLFRCRYLDVYFVSGRVCKCSLIIQNVSSSSTLTLQAPKAIIVLHQIIRSWYTGR